MEVLQVLGTGALVLAVLGGVSWWRAGRRGVPTDDGRRVDMGIGKGEAESRGMSHRNLPPPGGMTG